MKLRKLSDNRGAVDMIIIVIIAAIMFAISMPVIFPIIASVDTTTIDADFSGTPSLNASTSLLDNLETFYDIGPLYIVVVAAVAIVGAVLLLRRGK